jgi:hypothetical protein
MKSDAGSRVLACMKKESFECATFSLRRLPCRR